ncbi:hypothetical protein SEVIR_1G075200v4 [Setaria viridis]|uniref:Uncharacterized protein n=2 Tax=Setaria TaxID=4554 RepID=K3YST6_SETIT|nr:zinc finger CCCH domain-containing protein 18 [Setaria italica]XP_034578509.1 zinc finger CCCH domain-containing protein 18-like [Setaria viridis]RCV05351.1 hypothetical protein SETIT_1G076900v2 [Setaria italica]TKW37842.1 hypothetical protein SEVIR_1G075200v2 [Setaria viridis]
MASAVASNVHAGPAAAGAMSFGWLGPRLSFGSPRDAAAVVEVAEEPKAEPAISKDFIDFEFSLGGAATMLPADELFADGKLLPLRPQATAGKAEPERRDTSLVAEILPSTPERVKAVHPAAAEAALDPYVFSPKAPTCSSRWRELLRLRKVQTPQKPSPAASPSASPAPTAATPSRASNSSAARSLKLLLLQRNGGRASGAAASDLSAAPLLRDSSDSEASISLASSRFSLSSSSSSSAHDHDDFPRHSLDSVDPTPRPRIRLVRSHPQAAPQPQAHTPTASVPSRAGHSPARRRPSTPQAPPPPSMVSVDSPRMNASGKIVFQGLERSSSSPAGSVHSSMRSRSRVMDRSYSAGVRATPVVLNVPVCSRPVFGFFKDKKDATAKDAASSRPRSALGRRTAATPAPGGANCRDLGNGN